MLAVLELVAVAVVFRLIRMDLRLINNIAQRFDNFDQFPMLVHKAFALGSRIGPRVHPVTWLHEHIVFLRGRPKGQVAARELPPSVHLILVV